jgi:C1A family cysteine protease
VLSYADVTPNNVAQMKSAVNRQPLSVAIQADQTVFQYYRSGVLSGDACGTQLDHAVLVAGYGTDAATGLEYWLVKNSWDTTFGEDGYIRLAITGDDAGTCGVQSDPNFATTN